MGKDAREPSEWGRIIGEGVSDWWVFPRGDVGYARMIGYLGMCVSNFVPKGKQTSFMFTSFC